MNKYFWLIVLLLYIGAGDWQPQAVVTVQDEVVTGVSLPAYGTLCTDVAVRGGPDEATYSVLYWLHAGDVVQLREQPEIANRDWVMIKPARWIPLDSVCE